MGSVPVETTGEEECAGQIRCRELANSSSFCRKLYSEIEDVGWEHLVRLGDNLTFLSFRILAFPA